MNSRSLRLRRCRSRVHHAPSGTQSPAKAGTSAGSAAIGAEGLGSIKLIMQGSCEVALFPGEVSKLTHSLPATMDVVGSGERGKGVHVWTVQTTGRVHIGPRCLDLNLQTRVLLDSRRHLESESVSLLSKIVSQRPLHMFLQGSHLTSNPRTAQGQLLHSPASARQSFSGEPGSYFLRRTELTAR